MKSTLIVALIAINTLLLGVLLGRYMKPNAAVAQAARPGDYTIIPLDPPGSQSGALVIIDNVSGEMSAVFADENMHRMSALPRVNVATLFDRAAGRSPNRH